MNFYVRAAQAVHSKGHHNRRGVAVQLQHLADAHRLINHRANLLVLGGFPKDFVQNSGTILVYRKIRPFSSPRALEKGNAQRKSRSSNERHSDKNPGAPLSVAPG